MRKDPGKEFAHKSVFERNFTGTFSAFAGAGIGLEGLPLVGASVTVQKSYVQQIYHYGGSLVDRICGRIIEDPLTHPPASGMPALCF